MSELSLVTVLIPARNEEADIERCLRAVLANDYPHDRMEIVLVDGGSTDATASIAKSVLSESDVAWKIIDNPVGTTPSNLNVGLAQARGAFVCRVDGRSLLPSEYVRTCVDLMTTREDVSVVGGAQIAVTPTQTVRGLGIARALNNRFAMGGARYRSGGSSGPTDTVYLGAFRTAEIREAGGWDEALATNQDYDLNRRMTERGMVWFDARLEVGYVPRSSITGLWTQYHRFGRWKARYWRHTGDRPQARQLTLLFGSTAAGACTIAALGAARSWSQRVVGLTVLCAGLAAAEHRGSRGPAGGPMIRLASIVAMGTVAAGWVSGVWRGLVAPGR